MQDVAANTNLTEEEFYQRVLELEFRTTIPLTPTKLMLFAENVNTISGT